LVWNVQATERGIKAKVTPRTNDGSDFEEFPADPRLRGFDKDDRKYVAVALSSHRNPPVLNAVDSDWWDYRQALESHGVRIVFLCPALFPGCSAEPI